MLLSTVKFRILAMQIAIEFVRKIFQNYNLTTNATDLYYIIQHEMNITE